MSLSSDLPQRAGRVQAAFALHQQDRYADAARHYQALLDDAPDDPTVLHLFGVMHHQCGHSQRGIELIGRAIELRPESATYHANLAAACLEPANALAHEQRRSRYETYDRDEHSAYVDRLIAAFTPEVVERLAGAGHETTQPVFVFGMPRSGTTLVEQVLASHSQVFGAGELTFARRAMNALPPVGDKPDHMAAALASLNGANLREMAQGYLVAVQELLDRASAGLPARVVDKMPDNYLYLGLITLMFPRATLIHVRRDARDVALSCWLTHFRSIRWADQQDDLVGRLADHRRLMAHWQALKVAPTLRGGETVAVGDPPSGHRVPGLPCVHEVSYEALVEDFETEARGLVDACGLEFEPACLRFHETSRPVRTASVTQVRRPLYRQSVGRWKNYEPYLSSLFNCLPPALAGGGQPP